MKKKTTIHYYKYNELPRLEQMLHLMSAKGWQATRAGRLLQQYVFDDSICFVYRFCVSEHRAGTPADKDFLSAQQAANWDIVARKGCWILCRKSAAAAEENEALPDGSASIVKHFARKIKICERFRMWMILLATALLFAGYLANSMLLFYAFAIPMLLVLLVTLQIKYMQEGFND